MISSRIFIFSRKLLPQSMSFLPFLPVEKSISQLRFIIFLILFLPISLFIPFPEVEPSLLTRPFILLMPVIVCFLTVQSLFPLNIKDTTGSFTYFLFPEMHLLPITNSFRQFMIFFIRFPQVLLFQCFFRNLLQCHQNLP
mgnify:CR=1 FL=1